MALGSYMVIDQLTKAKPSLATSGELASLQRVWMTSWSILEISCALQHKNTSLWKSRCQQHILFNWFMDSEKNAMPATMTTNCSLRLTRRIGGETETDWKKKRKKKTTKNNYSTVLACHQKYSLAAATSPPLPEDWQYQASPGTSCSSHRWLECCLFGQAPVLRFACTFSTEENT